MSRSHARGADEWRPRWFVAVLVRLLAVGVPVVLGTLAARLTSATFSPHTSRWAVGATALAVGIAVSIASGRVAARLLPLAVLLKMTMIFPDRAPTRLKVARRATSKDELMRRLREPEATAREAATTMLALVTALGRHDRRTRGHSERVRLFCDLIGTELGLSEQDRGRLRWVGLLHDIGKLEVAAAVLNKPGKLDAAEMDAVREHPDNGAAIARPLATWLGPWFDGIRHHHERFDGAGYPAGLAGEQLSQAGRIVSVVDAFETMTAARSYKSPMSTVAARAELARCAGSHFDPQMVRAFLSIALPRLLWTMGPLTFLVNVPFLRWIPAASTRAGDIAVAGSTAASGAVGITAVSVAVATAQTPTHVHHRPVVRHERAAGSAVHSPGHSARQRPAAPVASASASASARARKGAPRAGSNRSAVSTNHPSAVTSPSGAERSPSAGGGTTSTAGPSLAVSVAPSVPGSDSSTASPSGPAKPPPGKTKTPPAKKPTPPGKTKTPPGKTKTPPAKKPTPPGQTKTPPGQTKGKGKDKPGKP